MKDIPENVRILFYILMQYLEDHIVQSGRPRSSTDTRSHKPWLWGEEIYKI